MAVYDEIERIYRDIRQEFEASSYDLVRPRAMRGEVGFAALYTPPTYQAELAVVGQNPGNFGPNNAVWDDEPNRAWMSGGIPTVNSYVTDQHNFAFALRRYFSDGSRQVDAKFVTLMNGVVTLQTSDGREFEVRWDRLSLADQNSV